MKPQLFCYTYAGGTGAFFDTIEKDLPEIHLVKPDYPGHGSRRKEPFCRDFRELADDLFACFRKEYAGGSYALFGYSMGSITAAEILRRIMADKSLPDPVCVFLAAHEPHTKTELTGYAPDELDDWVKDRTIRFRAILMVCLILRRIGASAFFRQGISFRHKMKRCRLKRLLKALLFLINPVIEEILVGHKDQAFDEVDQRIAEPVLLTEQVFYQNIRAPLADHEVQKRSPPFHLLPAQIRILFQFP